MTNDPLIPVCIELHRRIAALKASAQRISPRETHQEIRSIQALAGAHGLAALEQLAARSAQHALLPGHRTAVRSCIDHMDDALNSRGGDCTAILAALAMRLH
jgi:hypothetical protein